MFCAVQVSVNTNTYRIRHMLAFPNFTVAHDILFQLLLFNCPRGIDISIYLLYIQQKHCVMGIPNSFVKFVVVALSVLHS